MIAPVDEEKHAVGAGRFWQESWYFNWADPAHDALGLARIGFRFRQRRVDGLVLSMRAGRPELLYPAVSLRQREPWERQTAAAGLRARGLVFRVEKPLERWTLTLAGRNAMQLTWSAFTPVFDYHARGTGPPGVAEHHFEQAGRVTGWTRFRGRERRVDGTGQRDKSWGVRDWARVKGWNWISAQFGDDLAFNAWEGFLAGGRHVNGFLFRDGENRPLVALHVELRCPHREHVPASVRLDLTDAAGARYRVTASALAHFPLVKSGLFLQETHALFTLEGAGGTRQGVGVVEHAWHIGRLRALARVPELLTTARQVLLP